jgi:ABC-type transporter Mla subunit MlaD
MALQDLTPQLRTRLSKIEKLAGLFIGIATFLLLIGFSYYIYHTAKRKGWLVKKVYYYTFVQSAAGFRVGDPVKLLGFDAGEITKIEPEPPESYFNIFIQFYIKEPYYGYLWTDSKVKVGSSDFLGNRFLEVIKGGMSGDTNVHATYIEKSGRMMVWSDPDPDHGRPFGEYQPVTNKFKGYWLVADESPALTEHLERLMLQTEHSLPGIFALTNHIANTLSNVSLLTISSRKTIDLLQPVITNLACITENLKNPTGSLGNWLIPQDIRTQTVSVLELTEATLAGSRSNLVALFTNLNLVLSNVSCITSNFVSQLDSNKNFLTDLNNLIFDLDDFVEGLKRHWVFRSAFKPYESIGPQPMLRPGMPAWK